MRIVWFFIALLQTVIWLSCNNIQDKSENITSEKIPAAADEKEENSEDTPQLQQHPKPLIDTFYNDFAGLYAGDTNTIKALIDSADWPIWMNYSKQFREEFIQKDNSLRKGIDDWRLNVLNPKIDGNLDLLYLFSGPDILYPRLFFPDASSVYMFALEPIELLPNYSAFTLEEEVIYQDEILHAFRNIVGDSYFITDYMKDDLKSTLVKGVLPIMLVTAKIKGGTIEEVFFFEPNKNGGMDTMTGVLEDVANGVSVRVRYPDNEIQQYLYYSGNLGDEQYGKMMGMDSNQNLRSYFDQLPKYNGFIKAASYIPHMEKDFSYAIDILSKSESIFQDPTGLSCSMVSEDTSRTMYVMGTIQSGCQPINPFGWVSFDCLIDYHKQHPELKLKEPPFKFGYQKRQKQARPCFNYQLIVKK